MEVLALIPARSGSKGIKDKNVRLLAGKPLLAWSIAHALSAETVTRTVVSTDSPEYGAIARAYGAQTPFLRPESISGDLSTDLEVFDHALRWLDTHEGYRPDVCVHLRPTHPIRNPADIDRIVQILVKHPAIDSVRSVVMAPDTPFKMWFRDQAGLLAPVIQTSIHDACSQPRQILPPTYLQNASIDVVRPRVILEERSMTGQRVHGYIMDSMYDIDDDAQLERAASHLSQTAASATAAAAKTFVFDIDGVLATIVPDLDYKRAGPNHEMIRVVNFLHDHGHRIVLFTARGSMTGEDWRETTQRQMVEWGVKFDDLVFGKPAADYYIDDKALLMGDVLKLARQFGMSR